MSKSRLEKFLYALYSLDSSDLPTPLSRIEELYKCWVTGEEAPSFEPLSRVEKYLMAILGTYNVDELPNPLSRVEVLLYKLATGDDNLDDVKSLLSEHEELLAEIIRNGGVGGNIDIEYVLYTLSTEFNTLYNTAKKPVKSAILKGQTLVNLSKVSYHDFAQGRTPIYDLAQPMKANTTYTIFINVTLTGGLGIFIRFGKNAEGGYTQYRDLTNVGLYKFTVTPAMEYTRFAPYIQLSDYNAGIYGKYDNLVIIEGDYTNQDIPYFEGMKSVKMPVLTTTGKNLFDLELTQGGHGYGVAGIKPDFSGSNNRVTNLTGTYIKVNPNTKITFSILNNIDFAIAELDINGYSLGDTGWVGYTTIKPNHTITTKEKTSYIGFNFRKFDNSNITVQEVLDSNPMLEISSTATTYEPYKSNILTTSEEVELRGIGDVKDELDLVTGEATQRIGEVVLDGSENWDKGMNNTKLPYRFICANLLNHSNYKEICDSFKTGKSYWGDDTTGLYIGPNHKLVIAFKSDDDRNNYTVAEFKQYLSENPITVQYYLKTESVKTVDLSVVDQDGNNTELKTFNDITYVTLSSEGLIPEAELEVATKNEEVLSTLSLEMDDISTSQNTLEETANIQSENVDATMIATTEIYEELL